MPRNALKVRIITNAVSEGARALGETLESLGVDVSRVRASAGPKNPPRLNIKWGCFTANPREYGGTLSNFQAGDVSLNKLTCFQTLREAGVTVPDFTTSIQEARQWFESGARRVYERHVLRGSEGDGIEVREDPTSLTQAPLYVKGCFGERREYRIHVFQQDGVKRLFIQQKKRRVTGVDEAELENRPTGTIRNLANGWIFAHNEITAPRQQTIDLAVATLRALGLNFGGIDLIEMGDSRKGSFVLEVNCAPGLQGGTLNFYANAVKAVLEGVTDQAQRTNPTNPNSGIDPDDTEHDKLEGDNEDGDYDDDDY